MESLSVNSPCVCDPGVFCPCVSPIPQCSWSPEGDGTEEQELKLKCGSVGLKSQNASIILSETLTRLPNTQCLSALILTVDVIILSCPFLPS